MIQYDYLQLSSSTDLEIVEKTQDVQREMLLPQNVIPEWVGVLQLSVYLKIYPLSELACWRKQKQGPACRILVSLKFGAMWLSRSASALQASLSWLNKHFHTSSLTLNAILVLNKFIFYNTTVYLVSP